MSRSLGAVARVSQYSSFSIRLICTPEWGCSFSLAPRLTRTGSRAAAVLVGREKHILLEATDIWGFATTL